MSRRRWVAVCALALAVTAGCGSAGGVPARTERATSGGHPEAVKGPRRHAALLAALTYVRSWARPTRGHTAWYTGLQPVVTPAYAQRLAGINLADIPARVVTGSPRLVSADTAVVVADVPTDVGLIRVTVSNAGGRWLIDNAGSAPTP